MSKKHLNNDWVRLRATVKPRLIAALPAPCPRCGGVMMKGMKLDLGHITREASGYYNPHNVRLEHRKCNRRDGQRITMGLRSKKKEKPRW